MTRMTVRVEKGCSSPGPRAAGAMSMVPAHGSGTAPAPQPRARCSRERSKAERGTKSEALCAGRLAERSGCGAFAQTGGGCSPGHRVAIASSGVGLHVDMQIRLRAPDLDRKPIGRYGAWRKPISTRLNRGGGGRADDISCVGEPGRVRQGGSATNTRKVTQEEFARFGRVQQG